MASKAKQKGTGWELEICKFLGSTLGGNFQRVPNSGAFLGKSNSHRKSFMSVTQVRAGKGDIIPPDHLPKLNIEAKNYADISFSQIINGNCKQLDNWIEQTEQPADDSDISFTIFKITRKGSWVVFKESLQDNFLLSSHVLYIKNESLPQETRYIVTDHEKFFINNRDKIIEIAAAIK